MTWRCLILAKWMIRGSRGLGLLLLGVACGIAEASASEVPPVPEGHPRVYVRPADLPRLKGNLAHPKLKATWDGVRKQKHPLALAFTYLMTQNREAGRQAIESWFEDIRQSLANPNLHEKDHANKRKLSELGRLLPNQQHTGACVYDWCYDLFTPTERQQAVGLFLRAANSHWPGIPPKPGGVVTGHNAEGWLLTGQLPVGIAIYDEYPQMYNGAARMFFDNFKPVRDFCYQAHMHHQGHAYGSGRFNHDLAVSWLFRRLGTPSALSPQQQYVPYQLLYGLRPDGQQLRRGDGVGHAYNANLGMLLAGIYYRDQVLLGALDDQDFPKTSAPFDSVFELLFREPNLPSQPLTTLPLTKYFPSPMGHMIARTGWNMGIDSRDALVHMNVGEYQFGNHQHADSGSFQIYYRGALAIPSGVYQGYGTPHHLHYYGRTLSKNALLIHDPDEQFSYRGSPRANDSGQIFAGHGKAPRDLEHLLGGGYQVATVTAHAFGPDPKAPQYSYLAGDITGAYSSNKVNVVTRSMVTLNTGDTSYPCLLVVMDRIDTTNPDFKKTWLLHSIQEPEVDDCFVTIVRDAPGYGTSAGQYGGKLVAQRLLPERAIIAKIGGLGKEYWSESAGGNIAPGGRTDGLPAIAQDLLEGGAWRVEISPQMSALSDRFLHVLTVMDKQTSPPEPSQMIEADRVIGVFCTGFGVVFSKEDKPLDSVSLEVPGEGRSQVLVTGLRPGEWLVTVREDEQKP